MDELKGPARGLLRAVNLLACALVMALLTLEMLVLLMGPGIVIPRLFSEGAGTHSFLLPVPAPPWLLFWDAGITPYGLSTWFMFLVACIVASFVYLLASDGRRIVNQLGRTADGGSLPRVRSANGVIVTSQMFMAILAFDLIYFLVLQLMGINMTTPESLEDAATWELMYALANASVYEELVTRVLYIGLPLMLWHRLGRGRKGDGERPWQDYIAGGGFDPGRPECVALILFSSFVFGMAHVPGWDLWKAVPTFVSGLAFGWLFLRKGLYAAILLHFLFDYLTIPMLLLFPGWGLLIGVVPALVFVTCGVAYLAYFTFAAAARPVGWLMEDGRQT